MIALLVGLLVVVVLLLVITLRLAWRGRAARAEAGAQARAAAKQARAPVKSAPPTNVAVLTQYEMWMRRVEREQPAAHDDHWADLSRTPQYATWRRLAEARDVSDDVPHYMTRSLLSEVIYAAGGVEREFQQLSEALAAAQRSARAAAPPHSPPSQESRPSQEPRPQAMSSPYAGATPMREASYSFVNLLSWARTTVERTDRPYRPGSAERAGLIPALARGQLRDSVEAALQHLRAVLRDSRLLTGYALHAGAVPGEGTPGADILPDGRTLARLAEPLKDPVLTGDALEFTEARDMLTYATELMAAIEIFINGMLDAFAAGRPAAVGSPTAASAAPGQGSNAAPAAPGPRE